ncbi:MAG: helix-turn-helix transcriptional regulator [Clostridia bacterium]|nr:helix-turn-helix transcriptional regulator [Clostridia bacterium]
MKDIQQILTDNLIALRHARDLTQIELGEQVNYSDKTISKWENGDSCPGIEAIYRLASFYNVRIDDLLREDFAPNAPRSAEEEKAEKQRKYSKLVIALLAVMAVWVIATTLFIAGMLNATDAAWLYFIDAIPCSCVTLLVFNSLWGRRRMNYLIITVLLWTLLTAIYLHVMLYQLWVIFLLGIPVQVAVILWSQLKRKQ